jgi:hypothetical protein
MELIARFRAVSLTGLASLVGPLACSSSDAGNNVTCGPGTSLDAGVCYANGSAPPAATGSNNDAGEVPASGSVTPTATAPTFAGITSVAPASATGLQVTWSAATDAVTPAERIKYNIYLATSAGAENFSAPTATAPPGATSYVLNGLTTDTTYAVVVRAVNEAKLEDKNTAEKSGKAQADSHSPTFNGLKAAATAPDSAVTLSWDTAQDDLTPAAGITYLIYMAATAGGENTNVPSYISPPGATTMTIASLPRPNTAYFFVVRAQDAAGNQDANKNEIPGKSGLDSRAPLFAGCTSAIVKDASSVTVAWSPAKDDSTPEAQIAYDVFASKTPGQEDFTSPAATFTGAPLGVVTGLSQSTTYYFVCRAKDISNNEDTNKSERSATTLSDSTPPTFTGVTSVTNVTANNVDLNWTAATDDQTAQADIVYDVYESTASKGENFTAPAKVSSAAGATSVTLTNLPPSTTLYWVVRARDKAGNVDKNEHEVSARTHTSFALNVQPIFTQHCAVTGCHVPGNPPLGQVLSAGFAYSNIVNVPSQEAPSLKRVAPGDLANSYLFKKISGTQTVGEIMPPPSTNDVLDTEKTIIMNWISEGALNN